MRQPPDAHAAPRAFVPTRPTVLRRGEHVRITVVVPVSGEVARVQPLVRTQGAQTWSATAMKLDQRKTYVAELRCPVDPVDLLDYYVTAEVATNGAKHTLTAPDEAPQRVYTVTLV